MTIIENIKNTDRFILYIYFYLFMMPWNFEKWQMGALTLILFIWWIVKYKNELLSKLSLIIQFKPLVLMILFILYTYVSVFWSDSLKDGLSHVNKFHKYYFFIIPVLFTSLDKETAKNAIKIVFFSFATYAIFSLMIYFGLFEIKETGSDSDNPKGIMAYAIMSAFMAAGAVCSFFIALKEDNKNLKYIFSVVSVLCLFALIISLGRTAQLSLVLTISTLFIFFFWKNIFKLKILVFTIIASFFLIFFIKEFVKLDRYKIAYAEMTNVVKNNKYDGSFGVRIFFNKAGLEIINEHPLFGMGPEDNTKKLAEIQENDPNYINPKIFTSFHSSHMDVLTRYGIIGYLLLVGSIIYLVYTLRKDKYIFSVALAYFLIVFYTSLANVMLTKKPFNYVFISLFVIFSVYSYYMKKEKEIE